MQMQQVQDALGTWPTLSGLVYVPHTADEYERLVALLDRLIAQLLRLVRRHHQHRCARVAGQFAHA